MNGLLQLQNVFQEYLFERSDEIQNDIVETKNISTETRLLIYKNAYYSRLAEALETSYPILKKYMGDEEFESLAYQYIHHYHSSYRSIRWFGDQLQNFLKLHDHYGMSPHLAELSKFEWTMSDVFDAENADTISLEEIGNISPELWENMRFKLHPSMHILNLDWNVVPIWQALSENEECPVAEKSMASCVWIAWRKDLMSHFCELPIDEAFSLNAIALGKSFGEMCEGLCEWHAEDNAAMHAASLLKGWIIAGLISSTYL